MRNFREAVLLAQDIGQHLGDRGHGLVRAQIEALQASDHDQVRFWSAVEYALNVMASTPNTLALGVRAEGPAANWWLMQRVEAYRHLAWVAEVSRDPVTGGWGIVQLDAATGWRELAVDLHQLAGPSHS